MKRILLGLLLSTAIVANAGDPIVLTTRIGDLDANVTQTGSADNGWVSASVTEADGKLTGVVVNVDTAKYQTALTEAQTNAINSGITSAKVSSYDTHVADESIHVTASDKATWSGKQDALTETQVNAVNSGITSAKVTDYDDHIADSDIHVTAADKTTWSGKQDALTTGDGIDITSNVISADTNFVATAASVTALDTRVTALEEEDPSSDIDARIVEAILNGITVNGVKYKLVVDPVVEP